jgi:O-antigen ligase
VAIPLDSSVPIRSEQADLSQQIERGILIAFAFVLPLLEAPKNILSVLFIAIWLLNRARAREVGGHWDGWDTLIVLWMGSALAAAAFAGIRGDEWRAALDIVRYATILWFLKRSRYPDQTWIALLVAIVAGTTVGLAWGYYDTLITGQRYYLQLHSVGHVNHSAIYLAIVFCVAMIATRAWWRAADRGRRALGLALLALLVVSLMWMESRAAAGTAFLAALVVLSAYAARQSRHLGVIALSAVLAAGAVLVLKPEVLEKNTKYMQAGDWLNGRDLVWNVAFAAWREYPLFGVGMDNFARVGEEDLKAWSAKRGETFDRRSVVFAPHGHSLYINSLAERGTVGLGILLAVLAAWALALFRPIPDAKAPPLLWGYWGGAAGAWIITIVAGVLNTTLHDEQAMLCMLLLGGWLSLSRPLQTPSQGS